MKWLWVATLGLGCAARVLAPPTLAQDAPAALTLQFVTGTGTGDDAFSIELTEVRLVPATGAERTLRFVPVTLPLGRYAVTPLAIPDPGAPTIYREVALRFETLKRPGGAVSEGAVVKRFPIRARTAAGRAATVDIVLDGGMFSIEDGALALDAGRFGSVNLARDGAVVGHHADALRVPLTDVPGAKGAALLATGDAWMLEAPDGSLSGVSGATRPLGRVVGDRYELFGEDPRNAKGHVPVGGGSIRPWGAAAGSRCLVLESADPGAGGQIVFVATDGGVAHVFAGSVEAGRDVFAVVPVGSLSDRSAPRLMGTLEAGRYTLVSGPRPAFLPARGDSTRANR